MVIDMSVSVEMRNQFIIEEKMIPIKKIIYKIEKRELKKLEREQKECVKNVYDPNKDEWNKKHFNRCDGDVTAGKLDILEELKKKLKI